MPSWKAPVFVAAVSALPLLLYTTVLRTRLHATWTALACIVYPWLLYKYTIAYFRNPLLRIPSPSTAHFILGNAPEAMSRPPAHKMLQWAKAIPNDGVISFSGFFHRGGGIIATSPNAVREVLIEKTQDFIKPKPASDFLRRFLGDGLVTIEGPRHKVLRKLVAPAFHGSHIKELVPLFWAKGVHLCDVMGRTCPDERSDTTAFTGVVELYSLAARTTLDVIGLAGVGRDFRTLENDDDQIAKDFSTLTDTSSGAMVRYFIANLVLNQFWASIVFNKTHRLFNHVAASLRASATRLMQEKRQEIESSDKHVDIISILMRDEKTLNDDELTDELLTFLAAGSETTSSALTWLCYFLARDPTVQQRLRKELQEHLGPDVASTPDTKTLQALVTLPYLNAICNEALRLFPPVPFHGRITAKATTLCGYPVPAGVGVEISPWIINRLEAWWGKDAEEFVPERWLADGCANTGGADPVAFSTFGHGPRGCIGKEFARTELKCLVTCIVMRFEFELEDAAYVPVPEGLVSIKPKDGLRLRLKRL